MAKIASPLSVRRPVGRCAAFLGVVLLGAIQSWSAPRADLHPDDRPPALWSRQAALSGAPGAPVITQHPQPVSRYEGTAATFSVSATGVDLSYRWLFNGSPTAYPDAASLTLTDLTPKLAGLYSVRVVNSAGSVTSAVARLTVCTPGLGHLWQGRPWVKIVQTGDTVPGTGSTLGPLKAPFNPLYTLWNRSLHVVARSDNDTANAPLPTTALLRWRDGVLSTLVFTNTPLPEGGGNFAYPFYPTDQGEGAVNFQQGSMYEFSDAGIAAVLTPTTPVPGRPGAVFGPSGSFARRGAGVVISATIENGPGTPGGTGLFFRNGSELLRIADDTTDLPGVMPGYAARLTEDSVNFDGQTIVFSTMASINGPGGVYRATPGGAVTKLLDSGDLIPGLTNEVVTFGDVDVEGGLVFAVVGVTRSGVVQNRIVKFEADGSAQAIAFGDFLVAGGPRQVYFGTTSSIQRWTDGVTETVINTQAILGCRRVKYFYDVEAQGDDVAVGVEFADGTAGVFANFGEPSLGAPRILGQPQPAVVPETGVAEFSVIATGPGPLAYQWFKEGAAVAGATNATLVIPNVAPGDVANYHAVVTAGGDALTSLPAGLTLTPPPAKPVLFIPPVSVAVPVGAPAVLSVTAAGVGPLTYKWTKGPQVVAEGASPQLAFPLVTPADHGTYQVVVVNANGTAPAYSATLSVTPLITQQPQSLTVGIGGTATFSVVATGFPELRYFWFKGANTVLIGQTNATLELKNVQPSDAGTYSVNVSGVAGGGVRSATATLTVNDGGPTDIVLGSPILAEGKLSFFLPTATGRTYEVQFKPALGEAAWVARETVVGDGTTKTITVAATGASGFVRVVALP